MPKKHQIICVDDDPNVLQGFALHLRKEYNVNVAESGKEGLALLQRLPNTAVIVSDMRMPGMDGASFLSSAREMAPDSVRVLLTGYSDFEAAVRAVNEGQVFRFASKPCPPDDLKLLLAGCIGQYELQQSEKTLLNQTLLGSVNAMLDLVDGAVPGSRKRIQRLRSRVSAVAKTHGLRRRWQMELAVAFSQLPGLLNQAGTGEPAVTLAIDDEEARFKRAAVKRFAGSIIQIPRLQDVGEMLQTLADAKQDSDKRTRLIGAIIRLDDLVELGCSIDDAHQMVSEQWGSDVAELLHSEQQKLPTTNVLVNELLPGMRLVDDLRTHSGVLVALAGSELDESDIAHLHGLEQGEISEIRISSG